MAKDGLFCFQVFLSSLFFPAPFYFSFPHLSSSQLCLFYVWSPEPFVELHSKDVGGLQVYFLRKGRKTSIYWSIFLWIHPVAYTKVDFKCLVPMNGHFFLNITSLEADSRTRQDSAFCEQTKNSKAILKQEPTFSFYCSTERSIIYKPNYIQLIIWKY